MDLMLWNVLLSAVVAIMGFLLRGKFDELDRLSILLNKTREEMARDHITRTEFRADMTQLMDRFDRLERKIDAISNRRKSDCDAT